MQLVVISPPTLPNARGLHVLNALLHSDVTTYHLRAPGCQLGELDSHISGIHPDVRSKVVLHQHHELATKYGLKVCTAMVLGH